MGAWTSRALLVALVFLAWPVGAWDYEGHRTINQLALTSLPTNFPGFVRAPAALERIAFLGGEPDRWRNSPDLPFRHATSPDHFFDVEDLEPYQLKPDALSHFRYEWVAQLVRVRVATPERFPAIDPARDADRTKAFPGFLPWTLMESYARLKSAFSYLKAYEEGGTPEEIANAQANVIAFMGTMGHFAGDAAQPLHTTRHYNGWVGENPKGYTTNRTFHSWIDGGYLLKAGVDVPALTARVRAARLVWKDASRSTHEDAFPEALQFVLEQHPLVETLYQYEKDGKLTGEGETGKLGLGLLSDQLLKAGQFLGDLWYTAWQSAPPDQFLKSQLAKRKLEPRSAAPNRQP